MDIRHILFVLYDCDPNMEHVWSIERLLKNADVLKLGIGKNPITGLYRETTKPKIKNSKTCL